MAQGMYISIVGDASSYLRALRQASVGTSKFSREVSQATRGAAAGSGLFRSFGRSIAFASGGFVGFAGATHFLRESVDAAREAAVAQRSLAAQMKASGESFAANRRRIEDVAKSYARFGFQNDEVIQSLTVLERGTGNINKAIELQGLTADIARAKNIDLAAAANTVAKVFGGQETALRRAVPGLQKSAHGWDLIRLAQQKLAGQAAANTTAAERFQAVLHDTQEVIGTALLPILNKYLDQLSKWLDQMQRSGQLAKDAKEFADAISTLAGAIGILNDAVAKAKDIRGGLREQFGRLGFLFSGLGEQVKGFTNAYNNMIAAWRRWRGMADAKPTVMYPPGTLVGPPSPLTTGAAAAGAAAAPDVAAPTKYTRKQLNQFFDAAIARALSRAQYGSLTEQLAVYKQIADKIRQRIAVTRDITRKLKLEDQLLSVIAQEKATRAALVERSIQGLQLGVDRAGLTAGLSDDIAALQKLNEYLKKRIKMDKDNLDLQQQQIAVQGQINDLIKQQREQRKEAAREAAARRRERLETSLFSILGFGPGGAAKIPSLRQLRRQFQAMADDVKNASPRLRREFANIAKVLERSFVPPNIRAKVREMLNQIRDELRKGVGGTPRGFTYNHPGVGGRSIAFAAAGVHVGTVNVYNTHNVGDLENQLTKRQAGRAHNRRGAR